MYRPIALLLCILYMCRSQNLCHYTCTTCTGPEYFQCTACPANRGSLVSNKPIAGMCYCSDDSD